jgi:hypothetical protein
LLVSDIVSVYGAMWVHNGATVTLVDCTFKNNAIIDPYYNSAILSITAVDLSVADAQLQDSIVLMKGCLFQDNSGAHDIVRDTGSDPYPKYSALLYADASYEVKLVSQNGAQQSLVLNEPLSDAPANRQGISETSSWLQMVKKVCPSLYPA